MAPTILVVDDEQVNREMLQTALKREGFQVLMAESGEEALHILRERPVDLVILDIMMSGISGYETCRRIRSHPETAMLPVIMVTALDTLEDKMKGFDAGADDYLTKPFNPTELVAHVRVLLRRTYRETASAEKEQGKIISLFSLKGGVGISTLSVNLAVALAELWQEDVALVDLSLLNGECAFLLGLDTTSPWKELNQRALGDIDADLVNNLLVRHPSGVQVLAAPGRPEEAEKISPEQVGLVLRHLKKRFNHLVLDLPHDFQETTLQALDLSDDIVLVLNNDLNAIRLARTAVATLENIQFPRQHIHLLLNHTFPHSQYGRQDIERVLKIPVPFEIPYAGDLFFRHALEEQTLQFNQSSSGKLGRWLRSDTGIEAQVREGFENLAWVLSQRSLQTVVPKDPSPMWQRVSPRFKTESKAAE